MTAAGTLDTRLLFGDRAAGQISDLGSGAAVAVGDLGLVVQVEDLEVRIARPGSRWEM